MSFYLHIWLTAPAANKKGAKHRYAGFWFAFNSGCQSASVLITSILICYYNPMKTSFHYMSGYKHTHMTNSCYKFPPSAINRLDALASTSRESCILSSSEESLNPHLKYIPKFCCIYSVTRVNGTALNFPRLQSEENKLIPIQKKIKNVKVGHNNILYPSNYLSTGHSRMRSLTVSL